MLGIYGVMSYAVIRRTREIGIRMALGAARQDVLRMVVGSGMGLIALGLTLGPAAAFPLTKTIVPIGVRPFAAAGIRRM